MILIETLNHPPTLSPEGNAHHTYVLKRLSRQDAARAGTYKTPLRRTMSRAIALSRSTGYLNSSHSQEICMTTFDKRQEGFERKFALDEEQRFKAMARRNKLLGLWAAEKLGLSGGEADDYAKSVVRADFEEAGDEDVFRKIRADLDAKSVAQSDHQIRRTMEEMMQMAVDQIKTGT
jgi:hypothetical protein